MWLRSAIESRTEATAAYDWRRELWRRGSSCDLEAATTELKTFLASDRSGDWKRDRNWGRAGAGSGRESGVRVFRGALAGFLGKWRRGFGESAAAREDGGGRGGFLAANGVETADLKDGGTHTKNS